MKTIGVKVSDELHMQLKAAAKAYGDTLSDYVFHIMLQAIEEIGGGAADMEVYHKELKRLSTKKLKR
jgi:predicted DNA-binding protein